LRLTRAGNVFSGAFSLDNAVWTPIGAATTLALPASVAVGLAVTSHADGTLAAGEFDAVTIVGPGPPAAPTNLVATGGDNKVTLTWSASAGATSYTAKRSTSMGGPYGALSPTTTATTFTDNTAANGTTYFYVVSASNGSGEGMSSAEKSATPAAPPPPPAPANLTATPGNRQIGLSWTASSGAASYTVSMGTSSGGPYNVFQQAAITGTTFTKTSLVNGTPYFFVVTASNSGGESAPSSQASAAPTLPAPAGLTASPGNTQVTLSWSAVTNATSYTVQRSTTSGGPYAVVPGGMAVPAPPFTDTGLTNGTQYFYVISGSDAGSTGPSSGQVPATPTAAAGISNLVVNDTATTNPPAGTDGIANSLQWSIQSNFQANLNIFGDRTYQATGSVGVLAGKPWIRTAADSKNYAPTNPPLGTFTITGTIVYLVVDDRLPTTFLTGAGYTDSTSNINVLENTTSRTYSIWRKTVTSGSAITLPTVNNTTAPCYFVVVQ
jgi:fibronectin type 3 domain-containing protein